MLFPSLLKLLTTFLVDQSHDKSQVRVSTAPYLLGLLSMSVIYESGGMVA